MLRIMTAYELDWMKYQMARPAARAPLKVIVYSRYSFKITSHHHFMYTRSY